MLYLVINIYDYVIPCIVVPVLDACLQEAGTPVLGPVWISCGGGFSPAGACKFLEGIITHLRKSLKDTRYHTNQVLNSNLIVKMVAIIYNKDKHVILILNFTTFYITLI